MNDTKSYFEFKQVASGIEISHKLDGDSNIYEVAQQMKLFLLASGYGEANVSKVFPDDFV